MLDNKSLKGININNAINIFTPKSPKANEIQDIFVAQKAIEKNKNVSTIEPKTEEVNGAMYQDFFLIISKIFISRFCAIKNATPEPIAILIEIVSEKFVETNKVKRIPTKNPI